jgi:hypothetical protein
MSNCIFASDNSRCQEVFKMILVQNGMPKYHAITNSESCGPISEITVTNRKIYVKTEEHGKAKETKKKC